jgi:hypothetical protein
MDPVAASSLTLSEPPNLVDLIPRRWDVTGLVNAWITRSDPNFGLTVARSDGTIPDIFLLSELLVFAEGAGALPPSASGEVPFVDPVSPQLILETPGISTAPEPASILLAATGALIGLAWAHRHNTARRRRSATQP